MPRRSLCSTVDRELFKRFFENWVDIRWLGAKNEGGLGDSHGRFQPLSM